MRSLRPHESASLDRERNGCPVTSLTVPLRTHLRHHVQVVVGSDDAFTFSACEFAACVIPGGQLEVLPAAGHDVQCENPAWRYARVNAFLEEKVGLKPLVRSVKPALARMASMRGSAPEVFNKGALPPTPRSPRRLASGKFATSAA